MRENFPKSLSSLRRLRRISAVGYGIFKRADVVLVVKEEEEEGMVVPSSAVCGMVEGVVVICDCWDLLEVVDAVNDDAEAEDATITEEEAEAVIKVLFFNWSRNVSR